MRNAWLLLLLVAAAATAPYAVAQRRRVLTDDNFEHTTQAATGQTTGTWFVSFCSPSARACKDLAGPWDELGRELLQAQPPAFVSTVDPHASPALARRFAISTLPTLLLFRDRKVRGDPAAACPGLLPILLCRPLCSTPRLPSAALASAAGTSASSPAIARPASA